MTDVEQQRYWLACHEAAHAIIAHVLGANVTRVAIDLNGEADGECEHDWNGGLPASWDKLARVSLAAPAYESEVLGITCQGDEADLENALNCVGGEAGLTPLGMPFFKGRVALEWRRAKQLVTFYRGAIKSLADILYQHGSLTSECLPGILKWAMTDEDQTGECCHQCGMRFEREIAA